MSRLIESCSLCDWHHETNFCYHGELPVEHPVCLACGGELRWEYDFVELEVGMSHDEMVECVSYDEAGLPVDTSATVERLGALVDRHFMELTGLPIRVVNVEGVVDIELRPYVDRHSGVEGAKVIANVGSSVYSMALLELLRRLNPQLKAGVVVPQRGTYGAPLGRVELFPFGAEVGLYLLGVIPAQDFDSGAWIEAFEEHKGVAVQLAVELRGLVLNRVPLNKRCELPELCVTPEADELSTSSFASMRLEDVEETFLKDLLLPEPDEEEMVSRIHDLLDRLDLEPLRDDEGAFVFKQDSARVLVSVEGRAGRTLVLYRSILLSGIDLTLFEGSDHDLPERALTALNGQNTVGRCVIEDGEGGRHQIVFEKTLLGVDLDLSEFALTLAMVGEEADRMDNLLQEAFGGLRADEAEAQTNVLPAADIAPLLRALALNAHPDIVRVGAEKMRTQVHHLLEELQLPNRQDEEGAFWFSHGSARFSLRVWQDVRATYLTLTARVLRDVERSEGLARKLNDINRQIRTGAFVCKEERHVDLVETILADDLSIEEFAFALVSVGELADVQDDHLKALFGGSMGGEVSA